MKKKTLIKLSVLLTVTLGVFLLWKFTALGDYLSQEKLEAYVEDAGVWGVVVFLLAFTLGILFNIPGLVFLGVAFVVSNSWWGVVIGYVTSLIALTVHFFVVRAFAGQAFKEVKNKRLKKLMAKMDENPIRTTILIRLLFYMSPPANYALALSTLKFKHFIIGTAAILPLHIVIQFVLMRYALGDAFGW